VIRAAVLGVVLALALAPGAHASTPPTRVSLKSVHQSRILARGALSVKVAARCRGRVRVSAGKLARARTTPTGRRLNLKPSAMPKNLAGTPIEPADYNRNDGFSPGAAIHTKIPASTTRRRSTAPASCPRPTWRRASTPASRPSSSTPIPASGT
jgi:hypothetical protein